MFKQIILIISLLLIPAFLSAQAQKLRKASDYFPLKPGNVWQYKEQYAPGQFTGSPDRFLEIIGDTLIGDTLRIYKILGRSLERPDSTKIGYAYYHYSSDSTVVYRDVEFPQTPYTGLPVIDTRHGILGLWHYLIGDFTGDFAIVDTGSATYFGENRHWAEVYGGGMYPDSTWSINYYWRFVAGIGPVRQGAAPNVLVDTLVYARINGMSYGTTVGVPQKDQSVPLPDNLKLRVYPNPVYESSVVQVVNAELQEIELRVVNLLGQTVRRLFYGKLAKGQQIISWDGKDDRGNRLVNGIYFMVLKSQRNFKAQKFIFLQN